MSVDDMQIAAGLFEIIARTPEVDERVGSIDPNSGSVQDIEKGPSFDCTKAVILVEKLICANDSLASADVEMVKAYRQAQTAPGKNLRQLFTEQSNWRTTVRDRCKDVECLQVAYGRRTAELAGLP